MQHMDLRENCTQILNYLFLSKSKRCGESIFKHIFRMLPFVIFWKILEYRSAILPILSSNTTVHICCASKRFQEIVT